MIAEALGPQGYAQYCARLSDLLGIAVDGGSNKAYRTIDGGIPALRLMILTELGELAVHERNQVIPLKTLKIRIDKRQLLNQKESDRLCRIAHVRAIAETIFGDKGKARLWLNKPKARFDGRSPTSMLTTFRGCQLVEEMLIQIAEGYAF